QAAGADVTLAEYGERIAEIVLGHGPVKWSFRARGEQKRRAIDRQRFRKRGIVAEFRALGGQFDRLRQHEFPLPLAVDGSDEASRLGILRRCGSIGELKMIDPRLLRQE